MARDGLFFRGVATTNRFHVPAVALVAQGLWAALLALPVTVSDKAVSGMTKYGDHYYGNLYNELLDYVVPVDVCFYALMVAAVIAMRRKLPQLPRPYRTIGYPIPVLIYLGLALLLVLDFIYLKPLRAGMGYLIVLAGIPVYLVWSQLAARSRVPAARIGRSVLTHRPAPGSRFAASRGGRRQEHAHRR